MIIYNNNKLHDYLTNLIIRELNDTGFDEKIYVDTKNSKRISTPSNISKTIINIIKDSYVDIRQSDLMKVDLKELSYNDYIDTCDYLIKAKIGKGLIGESIVNYLLTYSDFFVTKNYEKDVYDKIDFTCYKNNKVIDVQVKTHESVLESDSEKDNYDINEGYKLPGALIDKINKEQEQNKDNPSYYHILVHNKYFKRQNYYQRDVYIMKDNEFNHVYSFVNTQLSEVTDLVKSLVHESLGLGTSDKTLHCVECDVSIIKYYLSDIDNNIFCSEKCAFSHYQLSINSDGDE